MFRTGAAFNLSLMVLAVASALVGQDLPKIEGDSLAGQHIILPDAARGKVAVLILGFSKASKAPTSAWGEKIEAEFTGNSDFVLYQLPVLEDVPGFVRGLVISSMKKGVPENRLGHFVPVLHGEPALKKFVNYKEPDDAYLVLLDRNGKVVYQLHGTLSEANYGEFHQHLEALLR
jgi:hypothetical protein